MIELTMKEFLESKLLNLLLWLLRFASKHVVKWQEKIARMLFQKAYLASFDLFPDQKLSYLIDTSLVARSVLLGWDRPSVVQTDIKEEDINSLVNSLSSDEDVTPLLCNYYRVASFRYYPYESLGWFDDEIDENLNKAREFDKSVNKLTGNEFWELKKTIKSESKKLKDAISKRSKERIEAHKDSLMPKVEITGAAIGFIFSVSSVMFLVSGFLYQYFMMGHFGVIVSDFFSIADYIASSTEVILPSVIATVLGLLPALYGLVYEARKTAIHEQYEIERKPTSTLDWIMYFIGPFLAFSLLAEYHTTGNVNVGGVALLMLWGFVILFTKLKLKRYLGNSILVSFALFAILFFSLKITERIHYDIKAIEKGDYKNQYLLSLTPSYEDYSGYRFVAANSAYVFLYSTNDRSITVIPKDGVSSFSISVNTDETPE